MAGPIRISILANASQARKEMDSIAGTTDGLGSKIGNFGKKAGLVAAAGLAVAGAAALKFGADSVKSASNAQQSLGATETVFGKFSKTVVKTSNDAAKQFGLDANTYRENANLLGATFSNQGVAANKLASTTKQMVGVGADLAATFGGTTTDAVGALGAAFKGEFDSLDKYGISLNAAKISAELAARGQDKLTGAALDAAKQQVTSDLIMQQSSKTRGAFAKESDTLANQQQILAAQFENVKAKVGSALLPILTTLFTFLNDKIGPAFSTVAGFVSPLVERFKQFFSSLSGGTGAAAPFMETLRTIGNTITTVVVPAVQSIFTYLSGKLMPVFSQVAGIISGKVIPIFASVAQFIYGQLVPAVVAIATKVAGNLKPVFEQLVSTFQSKVLPAIVKLLDKFQEYQPTIQKVISAVVKVVGAVLDFASAILAKVLPVAIRFAGYLIANVVPAVADVIGVVIRIIAKIVDFGGALVDAVQDAASFLSGVKDKIGQALDFIRDIPGKIKDAFTGAGTMLTTIGQNIIQGLVNGLETAKQWVIDKIQEIADTIPNWVKKRLGIASPSKVTHKLGQYTGQGLANGIASMKGKVQEAAEKVAQKAIDKIKDKLEKAKGVRDAILSLGSSIADTLTGDLFGGVGEEGATALDKFRSALDAAKATAAQVAEAMKKLIGAGVSNEFLESLASSGNTELIVQLAGAPDVTTLAAQYDAVIKENEDTGRLVAEQVIGVRLDHQTEVIRTLMDKLDQRDLRDQADKKRPVEVTFTSEQIDQLTRGKRIKADLRAYEQAGGH